MRPRPAALLIGPLLGLALLAGCGDQTASDAGGATDPAGAEPITPRAIAALALEHLPPDPTEAVLVVRGADVPVPEDAEAQQAAGDPVEVAVRYESDGAQVAVAVGGPRDGDPCAGDQVDECVELEVGATYLTWQEGEPEEDPGVVSVLSRRDGVDVLATYSGDEITGDPRDLDLGVTVDQLVDVATDPRISTTTSPAAIEAGNDLAVWRGED